MLIVVFQCPRRSPCFPSFGAAVLAGAGAAVGGIVGALVGAGVSEAKAKHVQAHLHKGGIAIVAHAATTKVADLIEKEWKTRKVDVVRSFERSC